MKHHKSTLIICLLVLLALLTRFSFFSLKRQMISPSAPLVAMIFDESDSNTIDLFAGIKDACEILGAQRIYDGKPRHYMGNQQQQIRLIENAIADGAQAVILRPTWCEELRTCLTHYAAKGIRFVVVEDCIETDFSCKNVFRLEFSFDSAMADMLRREQTTFSSAQQILLLCCTSNYANTEHLSRYLETRLSEEAAVQVVPYDLSSISSLGNTVQKLLQDMESSLVIGLDTDAVSSVLYHLPEGTPIFAVCSDAYLAQQLRTQRLSGLITCNYRLLGYTACKLCLTENDASAQTQVISQYFSPQDLSKIGALRALYPLR